MAFLNPDGRVVVVAANASRDPQPFAARCGERWMSRPNCPCESVATYLWRPGFR